MIKMHYKRKGFYCMNNTIFQNCFEFFVTFVEIRLFFYFISHRLPRKKKHPFPWQAYMSILLLAIVLSNYYALPSILTLFMALAAELAFTLLWMRGTLAEKLFWGCMYRIIDLVSESMVFFALDLFGGPYGASDIINTYPLRHFIACVYLITLAALTVLLGQIRWKRITLPAWLLPLFCLLVICSVIAVEFLLDVLIYMNVSNDHSQDALLYAAMLIFLCVCIFILLLVAYINQIYQRNMQLMEEQKIYQMEHQQLELVMGTSQTLRVWKHDLHHHLSVISSLVDEQNYGDASAYIHNISDHFEQLTLGIFTGNQIIDTILSAKMVTMKEAGIRFTHTIYLPGAMPLSDIATASLFGNLIDNAVTACLEVADPGKRYIALSIKPYQHMLTICMENSSRGVYRYDRKNILQSTKAQIHHGLGLKRIREISESVDGFCQVEPEADKFTVTVFLPLSNGEL